MRDKRLDINESVEELLEKKTSYTFGTTSDAGLNITEARLKDLQDRVSDIERLLGLAGFFPKEGMSEELFSLQEAVNGKHWAEQALDEIMSKLYDENLDREVFSVIEESVAKHRPKVSE